MKKLTYILIILLTSCETETKESNVKHQGVSEISEFNRENLNKDSIDLHSNLPQETIDQLPIHGVLNRKELARYFPEITDTIKDLRSIGSEKINLKTVNGITVSILHNTGTFDQMILCTHDSILYLIDNLYIGKAIMFDKKSHTIEYEIVDRNTIKFDHVDWGYVKKGNESEIDTVGSESYLISIDDKGKIKKTILDKS